MMVRRMRCGLAVCLLVAIVAHGALAAHYDEAVKGDISNVVSAPTTLYLGAGANILTATVGNGDFDVLRIVLPQWHQLDTITLTDYSGASQSFNGIQGAATWTAGTGGGVNPALLMGWTHFGPAASGAGVGQNILDNIGVGGSGSTGFTPPLFAGNYTMLYQDTGGSVDFAMTFNVTGPAGWIPGDFDGDEHVTGDDLEEWEEYVGMEYGADADANFMVDGTDFLIWQRNLGLPTLVGAVPEPGSAVLAAAVLSGAALARRRRARS